MKMGIKEFRERLSEVAHGTEPVEVTHHGRVLGTFRPHRRDPVRVQEAADVIVRWQDDRRADGVDLAATLAQMGIDPDGAPIDPPR